ncbi:MAG: hypothetical protein AB2L12_10950 [Smithellaceae bacterium]
MTEDLLDHWIRIIKPLFPTNAWIASRLSGSDYLIQIDWKLENDPDRQSKRSKKIEIIIKEESIDDYLNKNKEERELSNIKMKQWICERYNNFNINQDANISNSTSPDKWRISRDVLS